MQPPLQFQRIRAEIDVLLALDETIDDLDNLRMQQRLPARQRNHRHTALFNSGKALRSAELLL